MSDDNSSFFAKILRTLKDGFAGTIAGMAGKFVEYPLDTVKVRLQTAAIGGAKVGPFDVIKNTIAKEGVLGLYKGMSSPMAGAMMENAILFSSFGGAQDFFREDPHTLLSIPRIIACGAFSGVCVSFLLTPVELIKCRLQIQQEAGAGKYSGPLDCLSKTIKQDGLRGLFKGHTATLSRETTGNAVWFGTYETICRSMTPVGGSKRDLSPLQMMFSGAVAGMMYWAVPYPTDVIKSRLQTMDAADAKLMANSQGNTNFFSVGKYILEKEGVRGLYRGLGITLLRAVPANATIFLVYELVAKFLDS